MSSFLHQRPIQNPFSNAYPVSPRSSSTSQRPISIFTPTGLIILLSLMVILGVFVPWSGMPVATFSNSKKASSSLSKWRDYTLAEAASFVAKNGTLIVCAVSQPYLPFLNNWLISITRQKHQEKVLVIAEDYATLYKVNEKWPGHAVLVPPAIDSQTAHKFGSQGFFNFTSRRPQHLLKILELGYNVMYNDVDMVWLRDPFPYLEGNHDVYFTDDMAAWIVVVKRMERMERRLNLVLNLIVAPLPQTLGCYILEILLPLLLYRKVASCYFSLVDQVKALNHSHDLPPPGKKGRTYICSCMIFLRPKDGAKLVMKKWIEELQAQPWSKAKKANDQPAFNWALNKTAGLVDLYLLPQAAFPTGGLYFKNQTWVQQTKGMHVIIHNNYIIGFEKKIKRFQDYGLWLVDDHALDSPLGRL
ncbi:hypothetical protein Gotri_012923 [Gossypium trilobum]|uniref:Glycosyltransferase n=1 Tax=Gossypium trilobum TaxID=34281 RepID=A0A7J9DS78_9ROSI|nr:hypothetical protein [Gossypium trilobum]